MFADWTDLTALSDLCYKRRKMPGIFFDAAVLE